MRYAVLSAAGNRFAVVDTRDGPLPLPIQDLARVLCAARGAPEGEGPPLPHAGRLDGLLLVQAPRDGGDCRMVIHNADGSRPEACGNGLRCVARHARERGWAPGDLVRVETDAGLREVELLRAGEEIVAARARMGRPRIPARAEPLEVGGERLLAWCIDMGNPHCVVFVEDVRSAPVEVLGALVETHPRFPLRTNVEFVQAEPGRLLVRVWERGVGETAACGTGACAAAVAAALDGRAPRPFELDVVLPGGTLRVAWDGQGEVEMTGPCAVEARELTFPAGAAAR